MMSICLVVNIPLFAKSIAAHYNISVTEQKIYISVIDMAYHK